MRTPTKQFEDKILRNEELWESEHVLDSVQRTRKILENTYQKANLSMITSYIKYLMSNRQGIMYIILTKY